MKRIILGLLFLMLSLCSIAIAQSADVQIKTYTKDYLSFSYPADWQFADKSSKDFQQLNLTAENGNLLILVFAYNSKVKTPDAFQKAKAAFVQPFIDKISFYYTSSDKSSGNSYSAIYENNLCTKIADFNIPTYKLSGLYNQEPSTTLVHSFALEERFVSVIYFRKDKFSSKGDASWKVVTESLKVGERNSKKTPSLIFDSEYNGILNRNAISLPEPVPSANTKFKSVNFRVEVQVVVDEKGNVTSAKTVSGPVDFYLSSARAALKAKFNPAQVCRQPSPTSGIIVYNYNFR